jgi:hypothetical protein
MTPDEEIEAYLLFLFGPGGSIGQKGKPPPERICK